MLRVASRELVRLLDAEACLISQLEDGLLREVADYARTERQVARGLSYYLADYPATAAVLESRLAELDLGRRRRRRPGRAVRPPRDGDAGRAARPARRRRRHLGPRSRSTTRGRAPSPPLERHLAELAAAQIGGLLAAFEHEERAQRALPRDARLALERARGQGRGHERAHRRGRPPRRRRRRRARPRPRGGAQRRAWAVLHDIGKVRVPEAILNKPGSLTDDEWKVMRTHPGGRRADPPADPVAPGDPPDRAPPPRALGRGRATRTGSSDARSRSAPGSSPSATRYRAMTEDRPYRASLAKAEALPRARAAAPAASSTPTASRR